MKFSLRGASGVALVFGLTGVAGAQTVATTQTQATATAQTTQATTGTQSAAQQTQDKVTILGSLIATTPEDAPKPVEVITSDDLKQAGDPNMAEFIRSLSEVSPNTTGNTIAQTGAGILTNGFTNIDLRGQGSNGTLVLMNGRRLASTNGGAGADANTIPMDALQAVEILKSGASSTYGAGAVGGVINFRTRRDINAPQFKLSKTFYDGGGSWSANFMNGWVGDAGNVLFSWTHNEEGSLMLTDRDFGHVPFAVNPAGWSTASGAMTQRFHRISSFQTSAGANTPAATAMSPGASFTEFRDTRVNGVTGTGNVTAAGFSDCSTLGGQVVGALQGPGNSSNTSCSFAYAPITELVSPSTQDQVFFEINTDITDTMEAHFDFTYSKTDSTGQRPPSGSPGTGARVMDSNLVLPVTSNLCASSCLLAIPYEIYTYTPGSASANGVVTGSAPTINPFVGEYNARMNAAGLSTQALGTGQALMTSTNWRPYLFGGNPQFDYGLAESKVTRDRLLFNAGLKGQFAGDNLFGKLLNGISYDVNGQFNQYVQTNVENGDWLTDRLQNALLGYGGSGCKAVDRVRTDYTTTASYNRTIGIQSDTAPGTNGCKWFNPFQTNFTTSVFNGAANPIYAGIPTSGTNSSPTWAAGSTQAAQTGAAGYLNDLELIDWIWATRRSEIQYQSGTFDATFTGTIPESVFALPGGEIGWALGSQWRQTERRGTIQSDNAEELNLLLQRCPYGQDPVPQVKGLQAIQTRGCAGANGTGDFFSGSTPFQPNPGLNPPDFINSQTLAYYAEVSLPVLENLNFSASVRREDFNGGDISGDIWGVAGKWNITDELYIRSDYSTNFRAEEALDAVPGAVNTTLVSDTTSAAGLGTSLQYLRNIITTQGIQPEEDSNLGVGIGYQTRDFFGGRLRLSADYFRIIIDKAATTTSAVTILKQAFPTGTANSITRPADCSTAASKFVIFDTADGACAPGLTGANVVGVNSYLINGSGQDTMGVDYSISYSHPLWGGDLSVDAKLTQNLRYNGKAMSYQGVSFLDPGSRLGFKNDGTYGTGFSTSAKQRGNLSVRWANDEHSLAVRMNHQGGYNEDPDATYTPIINTIADTTSTADNVYSTYGTQKKNYTDYDLTYVFTPTAIKDLELRMSILNIFDKAPIAAQYYAGYDLRLGNPRQRRVEIGISKKF